MLCFVIINSFSCCCCCSSSTSLCVCVVVVVVFWGEEGGFFVCFFGLFLKTFYVFRSFCSTLAIILVVLPPPLFKK